MASEIKVDTIVNAGGDNDSGIDLATNDNIKFNIAGSQKASIESDGDVFIGKTTGGTANVGVEMRGDGLLLSTRDGNVSTILRRNSDDGEVLRFQKDASSIGALTVGSGDLSIHSTASGHVGFRFGNGQVLPAGNDGAFTNDTMDLGGDGGRFDDVFATNGTINTSDQNEKQDIASLTAKELNVAKKLSTLFKTFKWKNRVAEKGDKARTHTGIVAQDIQSAFSEEGLDASNPSALNAACISCAMMPECVLALSPFSVTLLFHLNVLNSVDSFFATLSSLVVALAISCFSFWSEVCIVPLVANMSSKRMLDKPKS